MRRGFKADAERHAAHLREAIDSSDYESMHLPDLARYLKVAVVAADRVLGSTELLRKLHDEQPGAWSAATLELIDRTVVAYNPFTLDGGLLTPCEAQRDGRTRSNVAHEFAHLILRHDLREVHRMGEYSFFSCDAEQEEEANWLAGALLLPRKLLVKAARNQDPVSEIANTNLVTEQMVNFRMNTTGARMQVSRTRSR